MRNLSTFRHEIEAELLIAFPWLPLLEMSLDEVLVDGREYEIEPLHGRNRLAL
ncbi:hypothetical protein [Mycobacterium uberis]|uniref:hypothetical protein n=1 Tax=Mycobacterium uberis TaxID=2162698 RepID=UPI0014024444|nr:hypothetical protein [Mycobacterium uberis]